MERVLAVGENGVDDFFKDITEHVEFWTSVLQKEVIFWFVIIKKTKQKSFIFKWISKNFE